MSTVPMSSIVFCVITLVLAVGLPALLTVWCVRQGGKGTLRTVAIGAVCFIVSAMVLEQICHSVVLTLLPTLRENVVASGIYACLAAGLFEETARLLGLRWLCRQNDKPLTGFAYGVGHGGIEAIMIGGWGAFSNLFALVTLRSSGVEAMVANYPAEQQELVRSQLDAILNIAPSMFLASGVERAITICLHIALSMLIYMVVTKRLPFYAYFISILLHAGVNSFAVAYQAGVFTDIWPIEALIAVYTAAVCFVVYRVFKAHPAPAKDVQPPLADGE